MECAANVQAIYDKSTMTQVKNSSVKQQNIVVAEFCGHSFFCTLVAKHATSFAPDTCGSEPRSIFSGGDSHASVHPQGYKGIF